MNFDVAIVGAGVAGLCCARHLQNFGLQCSLLESSDAIGGRVRTDQVNDFLLAMSNVKIDDFPTVEPPPVRKSMNSPCGASSGMKKQ